MKRLLLALFLCSPCLAQLPDSPPPKVEKKVIDKDFLATFSIYGAVISVDAATVGPRPGCIEANPLLGPHPSNGRIVAVAGGEFAVVAGTSYLLKRGLRHNKHWFLRNLWRAAPAAQTVSHIQGTYQNESVRCQ
jgi:hypothetical protein